MSKLYPTTATTEAEATFRPITAGLHRNLAGDQARRNTGGPGWTLTYADGTTHYCTALWQATRFVRTGQRWNAEHGGTT